jgi:ribulose-phosphate 3-epimerase
MAQLSASVICADHLNLFEDLSQCHKNGIDQFHFDVMDGNYVPRFGLYPEILKQIKENFNMPVDVHLMINDPEKYIDLFADNGADIFTFHIEATKHPTRLIDKIIKKKMKPGIALNPSTPVSNIKNLIGIIDYVLLMMIDPGVLGSPIYDFVYDKILETKFLFIEKNIKKYTIQIDGGVNLNSISKLITSGANNLVCGNSTIFRKHEDTIENQIKLITKLIS